MIGDGPGAAHRTLPAARPTDSDLHDATPDEAGPQEARLPDAHPEGAMAAEAAPLTANGVCTTICNELIDCFAMTMPGVSPTDIERAKMECIRDCNTDLIDCSAEEVDRVDACRGLDCIRLASCIRRVGCGDMSGGV